jgi:hypothetical protein
VDGICNTDHYQSAANSSPVQVAESQISDLMMTWKTTNEDKHKQRKAMERKEKEKFLIFTRVLMKYLESKDPTLHLQVKDIVRDCANRNSRKEAGYESNNPPYRKITENTVFNTGKYCFVPDKNGAHGRGNTEVFLKNNGNSAKKQ